MSCGKSILLNTYGDVDYFLFLRDPGVLVQELENPILKGIFPSRVPVCAQDFY